MKEQNKQLPQTRLWGSNKQHNTTIKCNEAEEGETIEMKVERVTRDNEPISDGAEIIYTERKHGVRPEYNIRTDRFDMAVDAMDKVSKNAILKRQTSIEEREAALKEKETTEKNTPGG